MAILPPKISHSFLMAFYKPTPKLPLTSHEHQPPSSSPYLPQITCFQRASLSIANRRLHLHRRALLSNDKFLTPKPPFPLFEQTIDHLTKRGPDSRAPTPQRKSLRICSNLPLGFSLVSIWLFLECKART